MLRPLDGPSVQGSLSVTSTTVQELKVGGSAFSERKVLTLKPSEKVYIYFGDDTASAPSAGTVSADGIEIAKNQLISLEATDTQPIYILAVSATATVRIAERA